jgi:hypothetical protein
MPSFLEPEYVGPFDTWRQKRSPETASALLTAVGPVLDSAVRTYAGEKPGPSASSRARRLALDAFDVYDPDRAKLRTHLMVRLQPLRRLSAAADHPIVVPERAALEMRRLRDADSGWRERFGRDPSTDELSDEAGLSVSRIAKLRAYRPPTAEGTMAAIAAGGEGGAFDPAVAGPDTDVWATFVHGDLSPTDKLIMEHSTGLFGRQKLSKQVIAARLGLSAGAVSQRAAKIQAKLDTRDAFGAGLV